MRILIVDTENTGFGNFNYYGYDNIIVFKGKDKLNFSMGYLDKLFEHNNSVTFINIVVDKKRNNNMDFHIVAYVAHNCKPGNDYYIHTNDKGFCDVSNYLQRDFNIKIEVIGDDKVTRLCSSQTTKASVFVEENRYDVDTLYEKAKSINEFKIRLRDRYSEMYTHIDFNNVVSYYTRNVEPWR